MPAEVRTIEEGPSEIRLVAHYPRRSPADVYRDWTDPERVRAWWGADAVLDLRIGGEYVFRWPKINAVLRGKYTCIDPDSRLEFTWAWDDEPDRPKDVKLRFTTDAALGSRLEVVHGPYTAEARDQELRQQHLDGWRFHLPKLADR
jgi:uncharacterized protein YndB with AHSA1/START domain